MNTIFSFTLTTMRRRVLGIAILFILAHLQVEASHIVGGDLSYECLGNDQYRITLKVYKDCFVSGPNVADFDNPANITIYDGNGALVQNLSENLDSRTVIALNTGNPCLIPPNNVCVEEGIYGFTVTLPKNASGYHISYERCCRNQTITNIPNPNSWGATFTIFISNLALTTCNDSPVFNSFPPIVICANEPLKFDHGATDAQGDSLVYEFCAPFHGADQNNPAPITAAPPPYTPVPFNVPIYTATAPLAGKPVVSIHPKTGLISGIPQTLGQFVVGVCVSEYRNGVLLSTTKRDFQFNAVSCQLTVFADILEDETVGDNEFIINQCDDTTVSFVNQSGQTQFITGYLWSFDMKGNTVTSLQKNPTFTFPGYGTYIGKLIVNPTSPTCSDTATIFVNNYPSPSANFSVAYDSCSISPVVFTDQSSISPFGGLVTNWNWDFGDNASSTLRNTTHQYADAGTFNIALNITDANGCTATQTKPLTWAPAPIIDITPSSNKGCAPFNIAFENNSYPITGYTTVWELGDGFIATEASPTHLYETPGTYTIRITITSPLGCISRDTFENLIRIFESPSANFTTTYDSCKYSPVVFVDRSTAGGSPILLWEWLFDNGDSLALNNRDTVFYEYKSAGNYKTALRITDENGCVETVVRPINWFPAPVIEVSQAQYRGCAPFEVKIQNTSYPINGYYTLWNLGDGYYSDQPSPTHLYEKAGQYSLSLLVVSPTGCYAEQAFPNLVVADPKPKAAFNYTPENPTNFNPTIDFFDKSTATNSWKWNFGTGDTSALKNPTYTYPDTGIFEVQLVVAHASGCTDTLVKQIDIAPKFTYFLPNAFTPNGDNINEGYKGKGELFGVVAFEMSIWNRWGEMIFLTNDPFEAWNGRINNTGELVPNGVYVCLVTLAGARGEKAVFKEFATVVR